MLLRRHRPGDRDRAVALLQEALSFAPEAGIGRRRPPQNGCWRH